MLALFLLQDGHYEKPYSDSSEIRRLLYNTMSPSSAATPVVDVTPPSPTHNSPPSSVNRRPEPTTPPKPNATAATSLEVQDTPLVIKQSGKVPHASVPDQKAELRNITLAKETVGHVVGPVESLFFLKAYVPAPKEEFVFDAEKAKEYEEKIRIAAKQNENQMYTPFYEWMQVVLKDVFKAKGFNITQTHSTTLTSYNGSNIRPDLVCHKHELEKNNRILWHNIELMVEFKAHESQDPYDDKNKDQVEGTTEESEKARGQSHVYGTCHGSMQSRHSVFQVVIIGDYARLVRLDRSGGVVTRKIPLSDRHFLEFFWRFCHLDASQRGWDTTMSKPSEEEVKAAKEKIPAAEKELGIEGDADYYSKICLGEGRSYIVHRIFNGTHSPFGRGTRGYAAYSLKTKEVVFLKSTWRVVDDGRKPEHEIYETLHAKGVKHIPTVVEYAKIDCQVTKTQDVPKRWRRKNVKRLRKFEHYIIVFKELCRKLENFQSQKELLTAFADAAEAHQQALKNAEILHRDISAGNILITRYGRGLLSDWDMAKHLDDLRKGGLLPERTGTFQFLAARFVTQVILDLSPHDRKDDVESFFHALQWITLRFVTHGMGPTALGLRLYDTFDAATPEENGLVICGGRLTSIQNSIWRKCTNFQGVLRDLLEDIRIRINSRYIPAEVMLGSQASYENYLKQLDQGAISTDTERAAKAAILLHELEDDDWFHTRLREAANQYDPSNPGDPSQPQKYDPPPIHGTRTTTTPSATKTKFSAIEYYHESEEHVSKKLKLDTGAHPVYDPEDPGETDDSAMEDDQDDPDYEEPRTRKTPRGMGKV